MNIIERKKDEKLISIGFRNGPSSSSISLFLSLSSFSSLSLSQALQNGHCNVVALLLGDPRTDVNTFDNEGCTPLWNAAHHGQYQAIKYLLASDRHIDTQKVTIEGPLPWNAITASEIARSDRVDG